MKLSLARQSGDLLDWAAYWLCHLATLPRFESLVVEGARKAPERWVDFDHEKGVITFHS